MASTGFSIWSLLRVLKTQEELESIQITSKEREKAMAKNVLLKSSIGKIHSSFAYIPKGLDGVNILFKKIEMDY